MIINLNIKFISKRLQIILYGIILKLFISFPFYIYCQNETNGTNNTINNTSSSHKSLEAECNGNTLNYYISANFQKYIDYLSLNFSEFEDKPLISSIEEIKSIGVVEGTIYEKLAKTRYGSNYKTYKSYHEIQNALKTHLIDGFITSKEYGDIIKMNNDDLTYFYYENRDITINYKLFIKSSDNDNLLNKIKFVISKDLNELKTTWFGCDENFKNIFKNLSEENENLTIALKINEPPFSYLDLNGDNSGLIVDILYHFANNYGYNLEIINLEQDYTIDQLLETNNNIQISGFLCFNETYENQIIFENLFNEEIETVVIIRYENYNHSKLFETYDSIEKFNNEILGALNETVDLTGNYFNNAEIQIKENAYDLFNSLLLKEINGFIIDELASIYYSNKVNERFVYFPNIIGKNYFCFIFENETIKNQFNEFLSSINNKNISLEEIFSEIELIDELTNKTFEGNETLNIIIDKNIIPFVYKEKGIYKGYEISLLYNFSYKYDYALTFNEKNEINNNVYIGCLNISNETELGFFSDTIYESNIVFTTRKDILKDYLTIKILDKNYREKTKNEIIIPIIFSNNRKLSFCIAPEKYNYTIILECYIFGLYSFNQFLGQLEYGEIDNKIKIMGTSIEVKNLLNANSIFPEENIINRSNLENIICPNNFNSTVKVKSSSSGYKIRVASIVGLVVVGILFATAILTIVIMYTKEIKSPKEKKYKLTNTSSNVI